jgi:hypothetical protein
VLSSEYPTSEYGGGQTRMMDLTQLSSGVKDSSVLRSNRLHSAKSSRKNSSIFPSKGIEELTNNLVDMRNESNHVHNQLIEVKYNSLKLMAKV